ncbi:carboxymuconolactone decarboxylase family protein [Pedobacter miscanthi]|jgi:AhpD family alkylhydroperoxidase|uniref:Carboxymuconolactone decarboxylase family protein n=1 Tax=Pedobacter miscanthi TaxID=2259170 RepID=A0A366KZ21_9SPHI|nr:carboxymuconolactone decarboxylase family protein [Pedobacter miscanthi]RBQ06770.1 carboxymuconolactone decarboxylase family protein [Pedobacter miscanthi]
MEKRLNVFAKGSNAIKPLFEIGGFLNKSSLGHNLLELVFFRVSQINGCAYCLDMHSKELRAAGEDEQRLYGLSAWKEAPYYTTKETAALAWAEAVTACHVPDEVYQQALGEFSEEELIALTMAVTTINTWNRLNIAFPNTPGTYKVGMFG